MFTLKSCCVSSPTQLSFRSKPSVLSGKRDLMTVVLRQGQDTIQEQTLSSSLDTKYFARLHEDGLGSLFAKQDS